MSGSSNVSDGYFVKSSSLFFIGSLFGYVNAYCIGSRISGAPSCAITPLSTNSTIECTTLCLCTKTFMLSVPKSHFASITSRPLLTSVDESIVTFAPIFQLGCFNASSGFMSTNPSRFLPKNGPPDAVKSILFTSRLSLQP